VEVQQTLGGRYKLLTELGSGGMAVVWKARDEVLGRSVAVKVLAGRFAGDEPSRARIRDEARAAATLSHPNIAQIYDFGESEEDGACLPYVVMELINGPTLEQRVTQGPIPPRSVFRICGEVAAALAAAHAHGLVHRDIKPANVMVAAAGTKVVDFGIAAAAGPGRPDDELLGTPAYLAPERLLRDTIEPASDVYALGVLLYRLLTDESPWSVESTTQMLDAHVYIEPSPMPQLPGVPPEITRLVDECLRKEPAERPSAAEAATILGDAADAVVVPLARRATPPVPAAPEADAPVAAASEAGASEAGATAAASPAPPAPRRRRSVLAAGGGVAAVLAVVLLFWALDPNRAGNSGNATAIEPGRPPATSALPPTGGAKPGAGPQGTAPGGQVGAPAGSVTVTATVSAGAVPSGQVTGTGTPTPTGSSAGPTTQPPPTTDPPSGGRTLSSAAGSVVAECAGGQATLTSWSANDGYKVSDVNEGPATAASVVFKKKALRERMTVTCVAGAPTAVLLPV
jgi:serine/threonine-protein kinase